MLDVNNILNVFTAIDNSLDNGDFEGARVLVHQEGNGLSLEQQKRALDTIRQSEVTAMVFENSDIFIQSILGRYFSIEQICGIARVCKFFNKIKVDAVLARIRLGGLSLEDGELCIKIFRGSSFSIPSSLRTVARSIQWSNAIALYSEIGAHTSIKELNLSHENTYEDADNNNTIPLISNLKHPEDLEKIDLSNTQITNATIDVLGKRCLNLKEINIDYCYKINTAVITLLPKELRVIRVTDELLHASNIKTLSSHCPHLIAMDISGIMSSEIAEAVPELPKGLRKIVFPSQTRITDDDIEKLIARCSHLTIVDLSDCSLITSRAVVLIAQQCKNLTSIVLCSQVSTDEALQALANHARNLKELTIKGNEFTDAAFPAIQKWRLESITIDSSNITDEAMSTLSSNCPALTHLSLFDCHGITDQALLDLFFNCPFLTELKLCGCNITNAGVKFIALQLLPHLKLLWLAKVIGGIQITPFIQKRASLTNLQFKWCEITDNIEELVSHCPKLETLGFVHCTGNELEQKILTICKTTRETHRKLSILHRT